MSSEGLTLRGVLRKITAGEELTPSESAYCTLWVDRIMEGGMIHSPLCEVYEALYYEADPHCSCGAFNVVEE